VTEKQELIEEWIKLHNAELHDVYTASHEVRVIHNGLGEWVCNGTGVIMWHTCVTR